MRSTWLAGIGTLLLVVAACSSGPNFAGLKMEFRKHEVREKMVTARLSNGLRVLVVPDQRTNLVMVGVHYAVGGGDDPADAEGLAHYVEHVMFNAAYHGDGNALRDVGLDANAYTSFDHTFFYLKALEAELKPALEIAARRLEATCDELDPATLARERDVVIEENKTHGPGNSMYLALQRAIWGADHAYGRDPGGVGFADVARPALCKFIEDHYGPASAVLVVAGNVRDDEIDRIRARFERVPARPAAQRTRRTAPIKTSRIVVRELERPTAVLAFPVPGAGTAADASIAALNGRTWRLQGRWPAPYATTLVVGDERERAILVIAAVDDAKRLDEVVTMMRRTFEKPELGNADFFVYKQKARAALAARLDDSFSIVDTLAAVVARGERPSRFRDLRQLDALTAADVTHWFDAPTLRVAYLLPAVGVKGTQQATDVPTALHQLDVPRGPASGTDAPALPIAHRPLAVSEHRLTNGLRVLLAPDPEALAVDARLVISGTRDDKVTNLDAQAAMFLDENPRELTSSSIERLQWYSLVGAPVAGAAIDQSTVFRIHGLALFADWHVWHLAWTVVQGAYRDEVLDAVRKAAGRSEARKPTEQPSADEIVRLRLMGSTETPKRTIHSAKSLEAFRRAKYRPETSTLIVSGRFDVEAMRKEIESLFGDWRADRDAVAAAAPQPPRLQSSVGIVIEDAPTVEIAIAFSPATAPVPREAAARAVLAELISARMKVVREGLGASYGVYAMSSTESTSIVGEVEPAYAAQAAKAMADELERIRTGDQTLIDDFVRARKRVLARALALPSGAASRAAALQRIVTSGGNIKELDQEIEIIRTLSFAAVQQLAARDIKPERRITAVRGKKAAVEAALGAFGIAQDKVEWLLPPDVKGKRAPAETPKFTATR